jgi:hypothetical protein
MVMNQKTYYIIAIIVGVALILLYFAILANAQGNSASQLRTTVKTRLVKVNKKGCIETPPVTTPTHDVMQ